MLDTVVNSVLMSITNKTSFIILLVFLLHFFPVATGGVIQTQIYLWLLLLP